MTEVTLAGPRLSERLVTLSGWLERWRGLWTHRPFVARPAPWEEELPGLSRTLRGLSLEEAESLHLLLGGVSGGPKREVVGLPAYMQRAVPGRKWAQIEAFVAAVGEVDVGSWVDWCSGKGHLGRTLSRVTGLGGLGLEQKPALVEAADRLARRVDFRSKVCDVLLERPELPEDAGLVALHACGALHDRALARAPDVAAVAVVPCCYHRHSGEWVPVRSRLGREHDLRLSPPALRFATAEEVAAPERTRRRRRRRSAFRQGLDLLVREGTGVDEYTPIGAIPVGWLEGSFSEFVSVAAEEHGLVLPPRWDADRAEAAGWEVFTEITQLSLVRVVFRRPVEMWFVLDRAIWLEEMGLEVEVVRFCGRGCTPRNLMILGRRG